MALALEKIPFGMSDILIGDGIDGVNFNGIDELQAEGGEISITPILEDITIGDYGNGPFDRRIVGYEGTVTIVAAQESIKVLQLALAGASPITDGVTSEVTGVTDSAIGTSLRASGKKVTIHPRQFATSDKDMDITIYKMISDGEYTRTSGNTQGSITISLTMLPRDGMNPAGVGNFYYLGGVDPNAA